MIIFFFALFVTGSFGAESNFVCDRTEYYRGWFAESYKSEVRKIPSRQLQLKISSNGFHIIDLTHERSTYAKRQITEGCYLDESATFTKEEYCFRDVDKHLIVRDIGLKSTNVEIFKCKILR
jgi:hypothetical protein